MAVIQQRVSDLSNTVGTDDAPVNAYVVPVYSGDGNLSFVTVDLTAEEFASLANQVGKATTRYVKAGQSTDLVVTEPKKSHKAGIDYAPVREFANSPDPTTGKPRFTIAATGRVPAHIVDAYNEHVAKNTGNVPSTVPPNTDDTPATDKADASA